MRKEKILEILENAKDGNGAVPMRLVRTAFDKLPEPCEDTISRQAAIDAVNTGLWGVEWDKALATAMLKDLPSAQPEQIWILCSERLPETDEFVLVSLSGRYKNIRFEHACEIADYADSEWFINAYPRMTAEIANDLIEAWMPLPEPYKGETT